MRITWNGDDASWGDAPAHAFSSIVLLPTGLSLHYTDPEESSLIGNGTIGSPYVLFSTSDLSLLQSEPDAHFVLGTDIALPSTWKGADFDGSFDGNGFRIIATGSMVEDGLFGMVNGRITRLGIVGGTFYSASGGDGYKGTLCRQLGFSFSDRLYATIENCYARGCTIETGGDRAGGLIGIQMSVTSQLHRSYAACERIGVVGTRVGGIRGFRDRGASSFLYFNSDTWGSTAVGQHSTSSAPGGFPRTTSEMYQQDTYDTFDFEMTWRAVLGNYPDIRQRRAIRIEWDEVPGWWDDYDAIHVVYEVRRNGRLLVKRHQINNYYDSHVDFTQTYLYEVRARLYVVSDQLVDASV